MTRKEKKNTFVQHGTQFNRWGIRTRPELLKEMITLRHFLCRNPKVLIRYYSGFRRGTQNTLGDSS